MPDQDRSHPQWEIPPDQPTGRPVSPPTTPQPLQADEAAAQRISSGHDASERDAYIPVTPPLVTPTEGVSQARPNRWRRVVQRPASRASRMVVAGATALALLVGGGAGGFALAAADGGGGGTSVTAGDGFGDGRPDRGGR